ncbi:carbohydrate-binding protein [Actinomycetota bacterium Odt1-20B]
MTTPGNNGEPTPSAPEGDDDPFGYLYADGQANGATPPGGGGGYGYPGPGSRSSYSYNQVRTVGERQYGQQQPTAAYGQAQVPPQQPYGEPNAHYAAPETQPGGMPPSTRPVPQAGGGGRGRGPNTKGLLIGAIAVVCTVAIGIGAAMLFGGDDKKDEPEAGSSPTAADSVKPSEKPSDEPKDDAELPETDAKALKLEGGTSTASDIKGAKAAGGVYVAGLDKAGAQVTWTVNGIPKDGTYKLWVSYGVPGKDANAKLVVNGDMQTRPLSMKNFAHAKEGDWEKGWTKTWGMVQLNKGTNTLSLACDQSSICGANLDQMWLVKG